MLLINKEVLARDPSALAVFERAIDGDRAFFANAYPTFGIWLDKRVFPGIATGERTIAIEQRRGQTAGLLILKHTKHEKKLCSLRVREFYQQKGLGIRLFETAFSILQTEKPLLSVSDTNICAFDRIFRYFGFSFGQEYRNLYRDDSSEFSFNGYLCRTLGTPRRGYLAQLSRTASLVPHSSV